jgi:hypothetical protein
MPTRSTLLEGFSCPTADGGDEKTPGNDAPSTDPPASVDAMKPLRECDEFDMWISNDYHSEVENLFTLP